MKLQTLKLKKIDESILGDELLTVIEMKIDPTCVLLLKATKLIIFYLANDINV